MHADVPDGLSDGDDVRVELMDGYWFEGEVEDADGGIQIRDRRRKSPLPEPDGDGDYRPHFVGVSCQVVRNSDGDPTFRVVDGEFRFHDPDALLEAEVVYTDCESSEWPTVTLGEIETFDRLG